MPDPDPRPRTKPPELPCDELVLAAIERAARHRSKETPAVPVWAILEHLDIARRSAAARYIGSRLDVLEAAGSLKRARRHGAPTWELTDDGCLRLQQAQREGWLAALPESPQHRAWRNARTTAAQEIERFHRGLREQLQASVLLLDADPPPQSDTWLELAESLQRSCRRVGSASYCLYEWPEPDDARADLDEGLDPADERVDPRERTRRRARRAGRRNISSWIDVHGC
jgi:hypothetical protein